MSHGVLGREKADAIRILVVDDDPVLRQMLCEMLADFSYVVESAADGREAVNCYLRFQPHLLLLDLNMPDMDGIDVIHALREVYGDEEVSITVLTSSRDPEGKLRAFGAGCNDFLYKPVDRSELLARVAVGVRQLRLLQRLRSARDAVEKEIHLVASLQQRLLPSFQGRLFLCPSFPDEGCLTAQVSSVYAPSGRASGDYFDCVRLSDGVLRMIVADVSGHGARAAFLMAIVRTLFHVSCERQLSLSETFSLLNSQLCEIIGREEDFVTALAADCDLRCGAVRMVNAGHCPALLVGERQQDFLCPCARMLGFFPEERFPERHYVLRSGAGILFYTDGFYDFSLSADEYFDAEAFWEYAIEMMDRGLSQQDSELTAFRENFPKRLLRNIQEMRGEAPRDDATALFVCALPAAPVLSREGFLCAENLAAFVQPLLRAVDDCLRDERAVESFRLALHEACANVLAHAYGGKPGFVRLTLSLETGTRLLCTVEDCGTGFEVPSQPWTLPPAEKGSGRGLFMMQQLMDSVEIVSSAEGSTVRLEMKPGGPAWKIV